MDVSEKRPPVDMKASNFTVAQSQFYQCVTSAIVGFTDTHDIHPAEVAALLAKITGLTIATQFDRKDWAAARQTCITNIDHHLKGPLENAAKPNDLQVN